MLILAEEMESLFQELVSWRTRLGERGLDFGKTLSLPLSWAL